MIGQNTRHLSFFFEEGAYEDNFEGGYLGDTKVFFEGGGKAL